MGEYFNDCVDLLRFSLTWIRDRGVHGLFMVLAVIAVLQIGSSMLLSSLGLRLLSPLLSIVFGLLYTYYGAKVILFALKAKGLGNADYNIEKFGKFIVLGILNFITVLFPWIETKLLVLNIVLAIVAAVSLVLMFVSNRLFGIPLLLAGLAWLLSAAYSSLRLFFSTYIYLSGRTGVMGSIRESWRMTNGKIIRLFGRYYLSSGFVLGGAAAVFLPFLLLGMFVGLPLAIVLTLTSKILGGLAIFAMMGLAMFVLVPTSVFLHSYLITAVYGMLNDWNAVQVMQVRPEPAAPGPKPAEKRPEAKARKK